MTLSKGLKFVSLMPGSGYGDAATQYVAGLDRLGVPVSWWPITAWLDKVGGQDRLPGCHPAIGPRVVDLWCKPIECDTLILDVPPPGAHSHWLRKAPDLTPYTYVAWEMDRLPRGWRSVLNRYERLFVPTEFNREVMIAEGIDRPIDVVPHIARAVAPVARPDILRSVSDDDFVFYTIGTWTPRKAMGDTIRAYLETFRAQEPVVLVVKTDPTIEGVKGPEALVWRSVLRLLAEYPGAGRVHLVSQQVSNRTLDGIHTRGDCFLSLTHSEGWGLCPFEALLFGNPAIVTGWGGQMDYLGADYPYAIDYELEAAPNHEYDRSAPPPRWARASREHAGQLMRRVFENRQEAREIAAERRDALSTRYSSDVVCSQLANGLGFDIRTPESNRPTIFNGFDIFPVDPDLGLLVEACRLFLDPGRPDPESGPGTSGTARTSIQDRDHLIVLAAVHGLQPILSSLVDAGRLPFEVDPQLAEDWFGTRCLTALHNGRRLATLGRLIERCDQAGLSPLVLKGPVHITRFYGDPGLRPMVDIDLLCRRHELQPILDELRELGFSSPHQSAPHHLEVRNPESGEALELHVTLWDELANHADLLDALWAHAEPCTIGTTTFMAPSREHSLILDLGHLLHHDLCTGMRPIVDLALALADPGDFDGEIAADFARQADVADELGLVVRAVVHDLGFTPTEPSWIAALSRFGEESLDRSLVVRLFSHWRHFAGWRGPGALEELAVRPNLWTRARYAKRVLFPSNTTPLEGLSHALDTVRTVFSASLKQGWRPRSGALSLKRALHKRRSARDSHT